MAAVAQHAHATAAGGYPQQGRAPWQEPRRDISPPRARCSSGGLSGAEQAAYAQGYADAQAHFAPPRPERASGAEELDRLERELAGAIAARDFARCAEIQGRIDTLQGQPQQRQQQQSGAEQAAHRGCTLRRPVPGSGPAHGAPVRRRSAAPAEPPPPRSVAPPLSLERQGSARPGVQAPSQRSAAPQSARSDAPPRAEEPPGSVQSARRVDSMLGRAEAFSAGLRELAAVCGAQPTPAGPQPPGAATQPRQTARQQTLPARPRAATAAPASHQPAGAPRRASCPPQQGKHQLPPHPAAAGLASPNQPPPSAPRAAAPPQPASRCSAPGTLRRQPSAASVAETMRTGQGSFAAPPPAAPAERAEEPPPGPATAALIAEHAPLRLRHSAPPLQPSRECALRAARHAAACALDGALYHSDNYDLGENIWMGAGFGGRTDEELCRMAVEAWTAERDSPGWQRGDGFVQAAGHFTQMVWRSTTHLGGAVSRGADGTAYVVCNYHPPGNVEGQFDDNITP
eukprot:TRINITY_DN8133_c0_g1_i8.p1 TRINITY_DN8133_c0_g1~~TRINITY_DN8133_c0_g1_i8.p1  ORF type:complete len:515 (+),score=132.21 TRINITY_DN8133_c0_g1_i8:115-1659(+)